MARFQLTRGDGHSPSASQRSEWDGSSGRDGSEHRRQADTGVGLDDLLRILSKQRLLILATMLAVLAGVGTYCWVAVPVWRASALLRTADRNLGPTATLFPEFARQSQVETEMLAVETRPVLGRTIETLGLNLDVREPKDLPRHIFFSGIQLDRTTRDLDLTLLRVAPDRYRIETDPQVDLVPDSVVAAGQRIAIPGGFVVIAPDSLMRRLGLSKAPTKVELSTIPFDVAVEALRSRLSVTRLDRAANLFRVSFDDRDRWLTAAVVNEVTAAFIDEGTSLQKSEARSTVAFLRDQSGQIKGQLETAEYTLERFRQRERLVSIQSETQEKQQRLADVQAERDSLSANRDALATLFDEVDGSPDGAAGLTRLVAFPSFQRVQAVQALGEKLIEAEAQRTVMRARWKPDHPEVVALDRQIGELESKLDEIGRNYLQSLNGRITSLDSVLAQYGDALNQVPARELRYTRLQRQAAQLSDLYSVLQQRLKEAEVREAVEDPSVVVVERAVVPWEPLRPRPVRYMALAGVAGLMLGLLLASVRERMDSVVRRGDDVQDLLGLSVLSEVPRLASATGNGDGAGALVPFAAEAYRSLRTSVFFSTQARGVRREILITSAGSGEGKSTTCRNIAIASAQQGLKTLLVDCDLRRGTLHRAFGMEDPPGLSDLLTGKLLPGEHFHGTEEQKLILVPAGHSVPNPAELLGSPAFDEFLEAARKDFEVIIADSPPVLAVTDAVVLSTKFAGVILVVRTDRTDRVAAEDAMAQLQEVGAKILGVVVNANPGGKRHRYRASYYHDYP